MSFDYLIIGAGFSGIVLAERFASIGRKVYFTGRLGKYKSLNISQCIKEALDLF